MRRIFFLFFTISLLIYWGCSSGDNGHEDAVEGNAKSNQEADLTDWQINHGIGPVAEEMVLDPVDPELAEKGEKVFEMKCTACHKFGERYVGPPLGNITKKRTPEFIMNMILNPDEMVKLHPEVKKMLAEYLTPMTFQNVSHEDARAILEYFRLKDYQDSLAIKDN